MSHTDNPVILCEEDYNKLSSLLNLKQNVEVEDKMSLAYEVSRALVVKDSAFPPNTIRIGSKITVIDLDTNKEMSFQMVLPQDADAATKKISILTPMSAAIIGFREGDSLEWKMPSGLKHLKVVKVDND